MSDTVDNVMDVVSEAAASGADEPADVVVNEETEPVEEAPAEEVPVEEEPEPVVEEVPVEEEPEPVAEEVAEPSPSAPAPSEPVSTQEVVQNVQEILSSTETNVSGNDLENRVKVLEERLENLVQVMKNSRLIPRKLLNDFLTDV
tara:strand:- start:1374 stop:1808 length:435 start_codon:yes stop_codon:yes gene_type:complete